MVYQASSALNDTLTTTLVTALAVCDFQLFIHLNSLNLFLNLYMFNYFSQNITKNLFLC